MAKGFALLVGLKSVDVSKYNGWDGTNGTWGCELDVDNAECILRPLGFQTTILKTSKATHQNVLQSLRGAAGAVESGDLFVFYYSGHGGQQPDYNSPTKDELDGQDETLVAYDREIIDDELNQIWTSFAEGVRIVMISDSCNSGTNYKFIGTFNSPTSFIPVVDKDTSAKMKAQMIHFGGCRDGFSSAGYLGGGAFTMALCNAWNNGTFQGNYKQLLDRAASMVGGGQSPQYNEYGVVSDAFRNSRPFQIGGGARVIMNLTLSADSLSVAKEIINTQLAKVIGDAIEKEQSARPCSVSGTMSASSGGGGSISGTVTCSF